MLKTQNLHVVKTEPLVPPVALKRELPASDALYAGVLGARSTVRDIIAELHRANAFSRRGEQDRAQRRSPSGRRNTARRVG